MDESSTTKVDLSHILTHKLLISVLKNRMPWDPASDLDFSNVGPYWWRPAESVSAEFSAIVFPHLKALSAIPLTTLLSHDLFTYLPAPSSPAFPPQVLGLVLLIDQGGRTLRGTDERWKYDFFDKISQNLARQILALPETESVYSKTRWLGEQRASFGYWLLVRLWLQAPLQHSEILELHQTARGINSYARTEVETFTGTKDARTRELERGELGDELTAYPRWSREGPPGDEGTQLQDFAYWELLMMDVHMCIIETFGGYPQRFAARGREATDKERAYLLQTENFDVIDEESREIIKEDVKKGRWTPLCG